MTKTPDATLHTPSSSSKALTVSEPSGPTSDSLDYVTAAGSVAAIFLAFANPLGAAAIGGITALGGLLGSRGTKRQVDAIVASVQELAVRLDEASDLLGDKLERDEVIEVVHEAVKDTLATSYAANRRRIADVLVNGLAADADTRTLRMFEKAAAALDDTAIDFLAKLGAERPVGEVQSDEVHRYWSERQRILDGPFGRAALSELVRFGLAHAEEIGEVEVSNDPDNKASGVTADLARTPEGITEAGRRFLAWVRSEPVR